MHSNGGRLGIRCDLLRRRVAVSVWVVPCIHRLRCRSILHPTFLSSPAQVLPFVFAAVSARACSALARRAAPQSGPCGVAPTPITVTVAEIAEVASRTTAQSLLEPRSLWRHQL